MKRFRFALILLVLVLAFLALGLNRLRQDSVRLSGWLTEWLQQEFNLDLRLAEPAAFSFWPEFNLAIARADLHDHRSGQRIGGLEGLALQMPWSILRDPQVRILAVSATRIDLHRGPLSQWLASLQPTDVGPPAPWRWPQLESPLRIDSIHWFDGGQSEDNAHWRIDGLRLNQLRVDQPLELMLSLVPADAEIAPIPLSLRAVPKQLAYGLALHDTELSLDAELAPVLLRGELALDPLWNGKFDTRLAFQHLNRRWQLDMLDADKASALATVWQGRIDGGFRWRGEGTLFEAPIEFDVALPDNWREQLDPPLALLDVMQGHIRIKYLRLGMSEWNGLSIEGQPFPETEKTHE